jgi:hypothetical protein
MSRMRGVERIILEVDSAEQNLRQVLKTFAEIKSVQVDKGNKGLLKVTVESNRDLRKDLARALVNGNIGLYEIYTDRVTLEDIFLQLTTKEEA